MLYGIVHGQSNTIGNSQFWDHMNTSNNHVCIRHRKYPAVCQLLHGLFIYILYIYIYTYTHIHTHTHTYRLREYTHSADKT